MAEYRHGTADRYRQNACRCTPCTQAHSAHTKDYRRRRAAGQVDSLVKATPLVMGIIEARADGWALHDLERALLYDRRSLARLLKGEIEEIHRSTLDRCMAVLKNLGEPTEEQILHVTGGTARKVPADPSLRRLKSLLAAGFRGEMIIERMQELGYSGNYLPADNHMGASSTVYVETAEVIHKTWIDMHHRIGPSWRTAVRLYRAGWFPPGCYDDEDPHFPLLVDAVPGEKAFLSMWAEGPNPRGQQPLGYQASVAAGIAPLGAPGTRQYEAVLKKTARSKALKAAAKLDDVRRRRIDEAAERRRAMREGWSDERKAKESERIKEWKRANGRR